MEIIVSALLVIIILLVNRSIITIFLLKLSIKSKRFIVYNLKTSKVILGRKTSDLVSVGSVFKLLTLTTVLETINIEDIDDKFVIQDNWLKLVPKRSSIIGYRVGDVTTIRELIYATVVGSGADATSILGYRLFECEDNLVKQMNVLVQNLKLTKTKMYNTNGLDHDSQKTTLEEIVAIVKYSLEFPLFREALGKQELLLISSGLTISSRPLNLDSSKKSCFSASKSGYTYRSKRSLLSIGVNNASDYIILTNESLDNLYSLDICYSDHVKLYQWLNRAEKKSSLNQ